MRFHELKERRERIHKDERDVHDIGRREWLCPDKMLIVVDVRPFADDPGILISVHRWCPSPGSVTFVRGKEMEGGHHDYVHDPLRYCNSVQLEYVKIARRTIEAWVAGEISTLPDTLF